MPTNGIKAMLEVLAQGGVRYLFGNPGTTELPLMDALLEQDSIEPDAGFDDGTVPVEDGTVPVEDGTTTPDDSTETGDDSE